MPTRMATKPLGEEESFSCRALNESEPKAKLELSANQSGTLNESKPKAQPEFSERDKQETIWNNAKEAPYAGQ